MTPDELRALADAIVYRDSLAIARAADYLRAQADAQPVAWRCEVRGDGTDPQLGAVDWRHYHTTTSKREAQAFVARCGNGIEGRAVPLYPRAAAPQAEPETFESELRSFAQTPEQAEFVEKVLAAEPRSEPFMPHARCGTPDEWGRAVEQAAYAAAYRAVKARDTGDMTREDMEARRCADAIRSLMEQPT